MGTVNDPFEVITSERDVKSLKGFPQQRVGIASLVALPEAAAVVTARLQGFAIDDSPVLAGLPHFPHELVSARTSVALRRDQIGATVVVVFEGGEVRRPIVLGVLQSTVARSAIATEQTRGVTVHADDQRYELVAEREIVLRCGDASITLTRAGRVIIRGNYILSRSTGYNKIKGAAVDIN